MIKDQKKNLGQSPHLEVEVVRPLRVKSVPELENNLMEDGRVDLFAQLHQDEPVPELELLHHEPDVLPPAGLGTATEHEHSGCSGEDKIKTKSVRNRIEFCLNYIKV